MNTTPTSDSNLNDAAAADAKAAPIIALSINHRLAEPDEGATVAHLEHGEVALPPDSQGRSVFSV